MTPNDSKINFLQNTINTAPSIAKDKTQKNNEEYNKKTEFYQFKEDIKEFLNKESEERFYILTGLRGVGKTTLLYQIYNYLNKECNIEKERILYLNIDRLKNMGKFNLLEYLEIFIKELNEQNSLNKKPLFLLIDETQYAKNWDLTGKIIFDETSNVFMIFTGSDTLTLELSNESSRRSFKKELYPLNFLEYLNLKYKYEFPKNLTKQFQNLIFTGQTQEIEKIEEKITYTIFMDLDREVKNEWKDYIQFRNFPRTMNLKNTDKIIEQTLDIKDRIIERDLRTVNSLTTQTQLKSYSILNFLAMQKPSEISTSKISSALDIPVKTVNNILHTFEKTHTIFHIEPYGSVTKSLRKSWEYYFLSTQMKACICLSNRLISDFDEHMGILLENFVASSLFRLKNETRSDFRIFYDPKKGGVDFILNTILGENIPIEVGIGKKKKKQIKTAINRYNADYGILISNKKTSIQKEEDIIHIPPITFSLL